ncbi:ABC-2 type transport system permease protein [Paenibacillus anaericanus]|uniref:ABC transporter permease n=1 Tax=Paenibacillus anaericanus TaxID=170367 RepID=UPI002787B489|nr:ABC transporter permease [Paenibacillus anaericanus]MDQ0088716.1 ABC-2 type transport system permease protein [Paenibacillus anaericanus]
MFKLVKHEIRDSLKNPASLILIFLPILMSKMIMVVMNQAEDVNFLLLSTWVLFAQVMVGIMLTGPNLIEERENRTMDALLLTPLRFTDIVAAKGIAILVFSLISQIFVLLLNHKLSWDLLPSLLIMFIGGILFVEIGLIVGLKMNSSKNGTAVSSVLMVTLFLVTTLYQATPEWSYKLFVFIPSIEVVESLNSVLTGGNLLVAEGVMLLVWVAGLTLWVKKIGKDF